MMAHAHTPAATPAPTLSVLGYQEDGEWVALALEMDIRGYGPTFEAAKAELAGLVETQIQFAAFKNDPSLLWFSAEDKYWRLYEEAKRLRIQSIAMGRPTDSAFEVDSLPVLASVEPVDFVRERPREG